MEVYEVPKVHGLEQDIQVIGSIKEKADWSNYKGKEDMMSARGRRDK